MTTQKSSPREELDEQGARAAHMSVPLTRHAMGLAIFIACIVVMPMVTENYHQTVGVLIFIAIIQGSSWNIMGGFLGQFSFGHAAFFGTGAYATVTLVVHYEISPWLGMILGAVIAAILAYAIGSVLFRVGLSGHYFALSTFAIAEALRYAVQNLSFLGGSSGLLIPLKDGIGQMQFDTVTGYFYLGGALAVVSVAIGILLRRSRLGFYWSAIKADEVAAASLGLNVVRLKSLGFAISGALMAIAGSFFAVYVFFIEAPSVLGVEKSLAGVFPTVVGGLGSAWGPVVGALVLFPMAEVSQRITGHVADYDLLVYGIVLILMVRFAPDGLIGIAKRIRRGRR